MFRRRCCAAWCGAALLVLSMGLGGCTLGGRGTAVPTATVALATPITAPAPSATPAPTNTAPPSATLPPSTTVAVTNTASPRPQSTATAAAAGRVSVDQGGVRFAYDPSLAQNVIFKVEPAIDMDGVKRPAYRSYELQGYPVTATYDALAQIGVFSVAEYTKTQPQFAAATDSLAALLASGPAALTTDAKIPLPLGFAPRLGQARLSQLAFAQGSGLRYLAQHAQTMAPFTNPFHYHFVGLTSDKQYYVEVTFRINASIVRGQPQVNNSADWEKVREFNRAMERQLGDLAASGFEPNLDLLDDLVRSIVVSAPTGAAQAPAMTPASTKAPATSASAGAPCITRFGISSTEAKPGDKVTLTWQASGDRAFVTHDEEWGALSEEFVEVPLAGTYTFTINPTLRRRAITYMLNVRVGETQTWSTALVYLTCPDNWFFASNSVDCPAPALRTTIVAQRFQRGVMLWSSANKRIYVLERPDGQRTWMDDTWKEGMPDSDPSIVAPSGLYQPVRGFGLVWRTAKMLPDALVRDRLGWATGPESAVGEGFVQEWPHGKGGDVFITGPDKDVYVLYGMGGWRVYATPTPGPTPTHPAATPVVETCRSAALPPSATVAPTSAAAGRVSVDQGGVRFAYDRTLADKVVFTFEPEQYLRHFNIPAYRKYVFEDHNLPGYGSARVEVHPVAEYLKGDPYFAGRRDRLAALIASGSAGLATKPWMPLPMIWLYTRSREMRLGLVPFAQGSGIRYLAEYFGGDDRTLNNPLHYHFAGLTSDGQYLVQVTYYVNASIMRDQTEISDGEQRRAFNLKTERQLGDLAASEFEPNLDLLDDLVRSIVVSAPTGVAQAPG